MCNKNLSPPHSFAISGLDSEPFIWLGNPQTFLINGKGRYEGCLANPEGPNCDSECSAENYLASIPVEAGKTYLLRIINAASLVAVNFAIANHTMTVVQADGNFVEPLEVSSLDINVAQRYSVLLTANQDPTTSYWMSTAVRHRSGVKGQAYLQYDGAGLPAEGAPMPENIGQDDMVAGPIFDASLVSTVSNSSDILGSDVVPNRSIIFVGTQTRRFSDNLLRWAANNVSNSMRVPKPLAVMAYDAATADDAKIWPDTEIPNTVVVPDNPPTVWNFSNTLQDEGVSIFHDDHAIAVYKFRKGDIVDIVLQNARALNGVAEVHSWHIHGHEVYIIGQGTGTFDPETDPANYNLVNPVKRDTVSVWPLGWTAVRFRADNVGAWPFHCAMAPHAIMGMGFNVITSPDMLDSPPPGLLGCFKTSLDPGDAEVCEAVNGDKTSDSDKTQSPASLGDTVPGVDAPVESEASTGADTNKTVATDTPKEFEASTDADREGITVTNSADDSGSSKATNSLNAVVAGTLTILMNEFLSWY